jgi:hypothetical protein
LLGAEGLNTERNELLGQLLARHTDEAWLARKLLGGVIGEVCRFFDGL